MDSLTFTLTWNFRNWVFETAEQARDFISFWTLDQKHYSLTEALIYRGYSIERFGNRFQFSMHDGDVVQYGDTIEECKSEIDEKWDRWYNSNAA